MWAGPKEGSGLFLPMKDMLGVRINTLFPKNKQKQTNK